MGLRSVLRRKFVATTDSGTPPSLSADNKLDRNTLALCNWEEMVSDITLYSVLETMELLDHGHGPWPTEDVGWALARIWTVGTP